MIQHRIHAIDVGQADGSVDRVVLNIIGPLLLATAFHGPQFLIFYQYHLSERKPGGLVESDTKAQSEFDKDRIEKELQDICSITGARDYPCLYAQRAIAGQSRMR